MRKIGALAVVLVLAAGLAPAWAHHPAGGARFGVARFVAARASAPKGGSGQASSSKARKPTRRFTSDQPDAARGNQTHIVYFLPQDGRDQRLDTNGTIAKSVSSMLAWFARHSGRRPRMDVRRDGTLDVTFVRGRRPTDAYEDLGAIEDELLDRGFRTEGKRFLVYAALPTGGVCGEGEYPLSPSDGDTGSFAALYLDSTPECGARGFGNGTAAGAGTAEVIAAQEWLHNEGLVPLVAPHECAISFGHVCTGPLMFLERLDPEEVDVMFPVATGRTLANKVLDRGNDDYFRHPFPTVDLSDSTWMQ